jgi:hypothetical protein
MARCLGWSAALLCGCGSEVVVIDFPPAPLPATEIIAIGDRTEVVAVGSTFEPELIVPKEEPLPVAALIYPGSPEDNGLTEGPASPQPEIGVLRDDVRSYLLAIRGTEVDGWSPGAIAPVLEPLRLREPVRLASGSGERHSCAFTERGRLFCWGGNNLAQLGDLLPGRPPAEIVTGARVIEVSTGLSHTCYRTAAKQGFCFGDNEKFQLGVITFATKAVTPQPVPVPAIDQISAGGNRTCVLHQGAVTCWGRHFDFREEGDTPMPIRFPGPVDRIATGTYGMCGLVSGRVYCAGIAGPLGLPGGTCVRVTFTSTAVEIPLPEAAVEVELGDATACARTTSGDLYCWGCNSVGQIGTGVASPSGVDGSEHLPVRVMGDVTQIDLGWYSGCAVRSRGTITCWGQHDNGQIGDGSPLGGPRLEDNVRGPSEVARIDDAVEVRVYWRQACAIDRQGRLYCWGSNLHGELGRGSGAPSPSPVEVHF